ncbi:hypothetical protein AAHN97_20385 [Chitinophaga niabensis]|uniref:hypothetical protein n=1 Tax=Chitinophaga niabensis TaxID=536979 RepID=UPI0031B9F0E4
MANQERKQFMYECLVECAKKKETITYKELARNAGYAYNREKRKYEPAYLKELTDIGEEEFEAGRPLLNVLVKVGDFPGPGFARWYVKKFSFLTFEVIHSNTTLYERLCKECFAFWERTAPSV